MRSIVSAAVACSCLSVSAFSPSAMAQLSGDAQGAEAETLEEIVVTAQKREERLQDVPIAISVLSGSMLDSSSDSGVMDAIAQSPGVFAPVTNNGARGGGNATITIRGVSAATVGSGTTAYYVDSIPFARAEDSYVPDTSPYDLDRIEVLRGPQGTLYGSSALNGVVRVLTKNPDYEKFDFKARGSLAGTDHGSESYTGDAAFNIPLIDNRLAARVTLGYQDLGGWIDKPDEKDANETKKSNVRVKLGAKLSDDFSAVASGWFSRTRADAPPFSNDGGYHSVNSLDEPSQTDFDAYSLDLNYDTSVVAIKSATSYIDYTINNDFDFTWNPQYGGVPTLQVNRGGSTVFTEEVVLNSVGDGPWRWTVGSMYRDAQDDRNQSVVPASTAPDIWHAQSKSIALYGELTRAFADGQYELTGGLRYFRDKRESWEDSRSTGDANGIPTGGLQTLDKTYDKVTPRAVLTWHASRDATFYASYSQGFRSGLFQNFTVSQTYPSLTAVKPDTLSNYEIGAKMSGLGGRLSVESAVYYIDWKDVQQDSAVVVNGVNTPSLLNGGSLSGVGVDFAVTYMPIDALTLGLNAGWNGLAYDNDVYSTEDLSDPTRGVVFRKGSRRTNSPETTAGATASYAVPLGSSGYRGRVSASGNYVSGQITGSSPIPSGSPLSYELFKADSVTLVHAGLALEAPQHWNATLYVDNATNEKGIQPDAFSSVFGTGQDNVVLRPRTYGVQFEYKY